MVKNADLEALSNDELIDLNQAIISVIKARQRLSRERKTRSFSKGERISFKGPEGGLISGEILRVNPKSLTIETDHGTWKIDPVFVVSALKSKKTAANVFKLRR